ncbi:MAG TPA: sucrase ferredoxin [Acidimicrobiales bacterium]|nr:sucrase ferredoxin [Acidimicrobiales bacterium]
MSERIAVVSEGPATGPRCAESTRVAGLEPVASVSGVSGMLLVEWPLPWPRDAGEIEALAPVVQRISALAGKGAEYRLQLVTPAMGAPDPAARRVVRYTRSSGAFHRFESTEEVVAADQVVDAAVALLDWPASPEPCAGAEAVPVDVLVCGHGSRDVCCGSMGTALARKLGGRGRGAERVRVWRTSHLGGHRFAPTAAFLPTGQVWGHLDVDVAERVIAETLSEAGIRRHFRGTLGISSGATQVVEREALCAVGWSWARCRREVEAIREVDRAVWQVRMVFEDLSGRHHGLVTAELRHDGEVAIPACRGVGQAAAYPLWRVDDFRVDSDLPSVRLSG